ncbi:Alpha/Beta hydrolase protein [Pseudomassariella vexata]|uniref:Alpha/Beta hydrolase protein n=1 Tax=Pseudomassariella vexata TaxID=1141098 RepID=A0A1Y2DJ96_9PEZI|nr:Alpha/Beta hydrolase protein [Pseudomassariella vexata]ORY59290.1 Alpha/Beta hydrolase protein [Pseudomassariella vexata]
MHTITNSLILILFASFTLAAVNETQHARSYFFVGGEYVETTAGTLIQNQMYVERLSPAHISRPYPIILMHCAGQDGTNFLNKPDGGRGWASWFLEAGYEVYVTISSRFTAVQTFNLWPQAKLHTQWPGSGMPGDLIFDAYYQSVVQGIANATEHERIMQKAGSALLDKIGPSILVTHSQGGVHGWSIADAQPDKIKALIQIDPRGPPFQEAVFPTDFSRPWALTSIPLTFSPAPTNASAPLATQVVASTTANLTACVMQAEPARKLLHIAKVPVLVETGEASYHAVYDHCTVRFLKQAGVEVEHLELGKVGIHGNGHMQFLERNSDEIAAKLHDWIVKTLGD